MHRSATRLSAIAALLSIPGLAAARQVNVPGSTEVL